MDHIETFLAETAAIAAALDRGRIAALVAELAALRARGGRLFLMGVGGSAANCSHATNDFRKLCGIEAYCATDNVAELTARINDEGWEGALAGWLEGCRAGPADALLVFSVGGGDRARGVSLNLVVAMEAARAKGLRVLAVVGRAEGHAAQVADAAVVIPVPDPARLTPHAEAFQAVVWHCLVSHPQLQVRPTKW